MNNKQEEQKKVQWLVDHEALLEGFSLTEPSANSRLQLIALHMRDAGLYNKKVDIKMVTTRIVKLIEKAKSQIRRSTK